MRIGLFLYLVPGAYAYYCCAYIHVDFLSFLKEQTRHVPQKSEFILSPCNARLTATHLEMVSNTFPPYLV